MHTPVHLPIRTVAQRLGVAPDTARRLIRAGQLVAVRVSPGRIGVDAAALEAYVERQRIPLPAKPGSAAMTGLVRLVPCNAQGFAVGEGHHQVTQPDEVVAQARAMRAAGEAWMVIAAELGVPPRSIRDWCSGRRRHATAVRVVARRADR